MTHGSEPLDAGARVAGFARVKALFDAVVDLNLRAAVTAGLGYKLINTKETSFELMGGVGYSTDSYDTRQTIGGKTYTADDLGGYLMDASYFNAAYLPRERTRLYRILEFIGHWSMLDVFAVALLIALVHFGTLANAKPGAGIVAFGAVVVLTMLATMSFDPRLIWDRPSPRSNPEAHPVASAPHDPPSP